MKTSLTKTNYIIIAVSVLMLIIGFSLMTGSKTIDTFNPDVFSFRRITLAPIVCIVGFVGMIFGIMFRTKNVDK